MIKCHLQTIRILRPVQINLIRPGSDLYQYAFHFAKQAFRFITVDPVGFFVKHAPFKKLLSRYQILHTFSFNKIKRVLIQCHCNSFRSFRNRRLSSKSSKKEGNYSIYRLKIVLNINTDHTLLKATKRQIKPKLAS